ncbi:MAG TPA: 2-oxo acid dehydrogenase subunit E2 [Bacillus bacterium]|uniref:Dihydrolipoamide acetyltransferase component of pyruvate dehydrogenase complex n=1 Tax=Siminovitchia fordii TaxID=254759 RepID=A0ABQ4K8Z6_9BACI|nr:dihydrolipoamide acetyltransferase family protein [Siminovitchia fordii]GIN22184.1 dihydrolipoamide acetyltransferase component of pyruvate dehydrogenase complex [Siminovitchia fordii]HBZ09748.1 2-oxo acid dehydrogenase subunit E2 [Bacillus sp. (in: firmicutes)]
MMEVKMPRTSDEIEESLIVFWHVEKGDSVEEGDVLVEVQTEKAVFEIEAEMEGIISEIVVRRGESAKVGDVLAKIEREAPGNSKEADSKTDNKIGKEKIPESLFVRISPRLRKLARDLKVDLTEVKGTGKEGAITKKDIENVAEGGGAHQETGVVTEMSGIRKTIGTRMMTSLQESAQLTLTSWVDVTELVKRRQESGSNVSWNALISYAAIKALKQHPAVNAHVQGENIIWHENIHLGIAVDTAEGVYVPVLKEANQMSLSQLDQELKEIVKSVMSKNLSSVTLKGSTFTVTNLGNFGIGFFTPILNPPEAGILGVGKIEPHLIMEEGEVVQRERIPLSLTIDHRVVDGAPGAKLLQTIADQCQSLAEEL